MPRVQILDRLDDAELARAREGGFFWLDLADPAPADIDRLGELFEIHELAVEDSREFGQRPKLDDYGRHALLVFYGVREGEPDEVHVHLSGDWMITIHRGFSPALAEARRRIAARPPRTEEEVIYRVLDALTDSFFPLLSGLDESIDELMDAMVERPVPGQRHELFELRRRLVALRRIVAPQRDVMSRGGALLERLPGLDRDDAHDYFRDVHDHLLRIAELIDGYREVLSSALDVYLSTVSNRLNEVMKQLTLISVIFLPLTFITGFFGQNFEWLVEHVDSFEAFALYGLGGLLVPLVLLYMWFRHSGFFERT